MSQRSTFVTVVAWIFIVGSGFGTFISLIQNIMVHIMFQDPEFAQAAEMPGDAAFIFNNFQLFVFGFFLVTVITLVSSIGLLKRKNWARLIFIGLLSVGILWNLGSIFFQAYMMPSMTDVGDDPAFQEFQTIHTLMQWFMAIMGIGIAILLGWIIKRLLSDSIKQEFVKSS